MVPHGIFFIMGPVSVEPLLKLDAWVSRISYEISYSSRLCQVLIAYHFISMHNIYMSFFASLISRRCRVYFENQNKKKNDHTDEWTSYQCSLHWLHATLIQNEYKWRFIFFESVMHGWFISADATNTGNVQTHAHAPIPQVRTSVVRNPDSTCNVHVDGSVWALSMDAWQMAITHYLFCSISRTAAADQSFKTAFTIIIINNVCCEWWPSSRWHSGAHWPHHFGRVSILCKRTALFINMF